MRQSGQVLPWVDTGDGFVEGNDEVCDDVLGDEPDEVIAAVDVFVERGRLHPDRLRQPLHGQAVRSLRLHQGATCGHDLGQ